MNEMRISAFFLLTIVCTALLGLLIACQLEPDTGTISLTVLHTNDIRSHLDYADRCATKINEIKQRVGEENVLLIDAGDAYSGTPYFTLYQGEADLWFMEYMGYDAMCLGNHEFDKGPSVLRSFAEAADFPILCANFDFSHEPNLAGEIVPSVIINKNGLRYGIFGLTTEETKEISSPGDNIVINDYLSTANNMVAELKSGKINKIIAVTHIGWENDLKLAQQVSGIDIIIGGHSQTVPDVYPTIVNTGEEPTLIVQAGDHGEYLGHLAINFNKAGIITGWEGSQLITIDENIAQDDACTAKLAMYQKPITELMNKVIGRTLVELDGEHDHVRARETNLGDIIADAMLDKANRFGANIAILNSGGIRDSIPAGDISLGQVMTVLPFENYLVVVGLTGEQIVAALENGVSQAEELKGRFPQVAGLRFTWDSRAPAGHRIISVELDTPGGYQPLGAFSSAIYRVVTNDFVAEGGDGYTIFKEGANRVNLGFTGSEVFTEYIQTNSPITKLPEGRIRNK
ncbi:bifunctional metallophosphatase/5'-nucleotidase [Chloroflexota bacterium]